MAALILSCRAAYSPSTMMIPSLATATVMFPPWPSSIYMLSPRSVVLISTLEKSGGGGGGLAAGCCASAAPASHKVVATVAIPVRSIKPSLAKLFLLARHPCGLPSNMPRHPPLPRVAHERDVAVETVHELAIGQSDEQREHHTEMQRQQGPHCGCVAQQ